MALCGYFCEWANEIKARKFVPQQQLEHSHQLFYKKCHFDTPKAYFIILSHYFTIYPSSDVLFFNFIH